MNRITIEDINCTDSDCDWERYPNTGHECANELCKHEAEVAVVYDETAVYYHCRQHAELLVSAEILHGSN